VTTTTKEKRDQFINAGSEIEAELYKIFKKDAKLTIADIGACDGLSTIIYAKMFPNSFVHVFEPITENLSAAVGNFQDYDIMSRTAIHLIALSNRKGSAQFFKSKGQAPKVEGWDTGNKSSSLLRPKRHLSEHSWCKFDQAVVVVDKLDNFGYSIDFAHIDVQGAELLVLKGGEKTLRNAKAIWIEVSNIELYANQALRSQISSQLKQMGFTCTKDTCGNNKYGDMLWRHV
jgi:FkbM family methyltransferase